MSMRRFLNFARDRRGNMALMSALFMMPLVGVGGLAVDHMTAASAKTRFDAAADAAALAAVNTAKAVAVGKTQWGQGDPVEAGKEAALRVFSANAKSAGNVAIPTPTVTLTSGGGEYVADVTWSTTSPASFGQMFGLKGHGLSGRAEARSSNPVFSDFYIVMDLSASMLIGATDADVRKTYDFLGCAFACHVPKAQYFDPHSNTVNGLRLHTDVRLRIDVMKDAIVSALEELRRRQAAPNQYRFGVYGFSSENRVFLDINDPRSTDFDAVIAAVRSAETWPTIGGGTFFPYLFPWIQQRVKAGGDGSSTNPAQRIILISDGVQNGHTYVPPSGRLQFTTLPTVGPTSYAVAGINPALCAPIKQLGVEIVTIQVEYVVPSRIPGVLVAADAAPIFEYIANTLLPLMPKTMGACATSPQHYAKANTPAEIYTAISGAFSTARKVAITR